MFNIEVWKQAKKEKHIKYEELAKQTGIGISTIKDIFRGVTYAPRADTVEAIEKALGINQPNASKGVWIPVYGNIAAGIPIEAIEDIIDQEEITVEMANSGEHIALRVKGSSMEPRIVNGDVVIIRRQETIENGEIAAVFVNGNDVTLKQIKFEDNGIWLIPFNSAYQHKFYSKKECEQLPVRILGKLVELRAKF